MLTLHPSGKHEVARTEDQNALSEAARAARTLRGIGTDCSARAMLILAAQRFPDDDLTLAAKKLTAEFEIFRAQIKPIAAQVQAEKKALSERLAPWSIAATNRLYEVKDKIRYVEQCLEAVRRRGGTPEGNAGELYRKGVSMAEIERIHGKQATEAELSAKRAALLEVQEKLELFLKTGDLTVLPGDLVPYKRVEISSGTGKTIAGDPQRAG